MNRRLLLALAASGALALLLLAGAVTSAAQPATVSAAEVQRLEDAVTELENELSALHLRDASRARSFDGELQEVRDDVAHLKVGLRNDAGAPRHEYTPSACRSRCSIGVKPTDCPSMPRPRGWLAAYRQCHSQAARGRTRGASGRAGWRRTCGGRPLTDTAAGSRMRTDAPGTRIV